MIPEGTDNADALKHFTEQTGLVTPGFVGGKYDSKRRDLLIHLQNVAPGEAGLITGLLALWTDPALAGHLAGLKLGCKLLSFEGGKITVTTPQDIAAPKLN